MSSPVRMRVCPLATCLALLCSSLGCGDDGSSQESDAYVADASNADGASPAADATTAPTVDAAAPTVDAATDDAMEIPTGDTCLAPRPLLFSGGASGGTATDVGDLAALADDHASPYCTGDGPDIVYSFTTDATLDLQVSVNGTGSFLSVIYLRSSCASTDEVICTAAVGASTSLTMTSLAPGTYYLFIDSKSLAAAGPYTLSATLTPAGTGGSCSTPETLVFSAAPNGGTATATGDLSDMLDHHGSAYCAGDGPDHVYSFTTGTTLDLQVSVTGTGNLDPTLYLRSSCASSDELVCSNGMGSGATIATTGLPAGTYYLFIDSASPSATGPYTLTAALTAP